VILRLTLVAAVLAGLLPAAATTAAAAGPLPRIESTTPAGQRLGHLRVAGTEQRFIPRGANYIRLTEFTLNGNPVQYHSTFEPGRYDASRAENTLAALRHDGYNTVRVFIDPGNIEAANAGHPHGLGRGVGDWDPLYEPYMDNVADFVRRAGTHGIYVFMSLDLFPQNEYYYQQTGSVDPSHVDGWNLFYLHAGFQQAKASYLANFVDALRARIGDAAMSTILAYALDNEAFVLGDKAPFSRASGMVNTAAGSFDMAVPAQRQQAQDANFVEYARKMADTIRAKDPATMITMGAFTYHAVGKSGPAGLPVRCDTNCQPGVDYRYPARLSSLTQWANLSFVDLHVYPDGTTGSLDRNLNSIEWTAVRGPVIIGEYGAFKHWYPSIITAAYAMRDLQVATCSRGLAGWLFWTWDTTETADQRRLHTLADSGGAINGQLAPIVRPDPCRR
jgi:hypothetical protein